ncbi:MAG: hypothetical protein IKW74_04195, partial [Thermoguttaceae bacterium]|nr:hypothetical protein [Thermoguttaceae bacterium]
QVIPEYFLVIFDEFYEIFQRGLLNAEWITEQMRKSKRLLRLPVAGVFCVLKNKFPRKHILYFLPECAD